MYSVHPQSQSLDLKQFEVIWASWTAIRWPKDIIFLHFVHQKLL
jgi:hypothetical protein